MNVKKAHLLLDILTSSKIQVKWFWIIIWNHTFNCLNHPTVNHEWICYYNKHWMSYYIRFLIISLNNEKCIHSFISLNCLGLRDPKLGGLVSNPKHTYLPNTRWRYYKYIYFKCSIILQQIKHLFEFLGQDKQKCVSYVISAYNIHAYRIMAK